VSGFITSSYSNATNSLLNTLLRISISTEKRKLYYSVGSLPPTLSFKANEVGVMGNTVHLKPEISLFRRGGGFLPNIIREFKKKMPERPCPNKAFN